MKCLNHEVWCIEGISNNRSDPIISDLVGIFQNIEHCTVTPTSTNPVSKTRKTDNININIFILYTIDNLEEQPLQLLRPSEL
jgi:hypothetical protein